VVWDGDAALTAIRKAVTSFEKQYPNVHVKLESSPQSYQEKLLTQYAAGVAPDVAMMDPPNFQRFARRHAILPLNPFFAETPDFHLDDYYKPIVDAHSYQGTLYVLPRDIAPIGLIYYNKKLFQEAGIPPPDGSWTWDFGPRPALREKDFIWVMQQLTKPGKQWGFAPGWQGAWADTMVYSLGARYADNPEAPTKVLYDEERVVKAYQFAQDMALKYKWMPSQAEVTSVLQSNARAMFVQGKVAMFQSGIWEVPQMRRELIPGTPGFFEWDITLAPAYKDGTRAFPTGGSGYCILASTKHPKEAWNLTRWMAGPPGMLAMAEAGLAQPAIRKLAQAPPWIPGPDTPLDQRYPASRIVTDTAVPFVVFDPTADYWPEVKGYAAPWLDKIFLGGITAKDALASATSECQSRLETIRAEREKAQPYNWGLGIAIGALLCLAGIAWVYWPELKIKRTAKAKQEARTAYLFIAPWIIGLFVFTLGPMLLSLMMSFADWDIIQQAKWRGLQNYQEALSVDPRFWVSLRVTLVYTVVSVPLGILGSLLLALLLNTKVRGIPVYRTCFYLPSLASGVAAALIWKRVFQPEGGLLNTLIYGVDGHGNFLGLATWLGHYGTPGEQVNWLGNENTALAALIMMSIWGIGGGMVILLAGLQGIPQHYYEAAIMDGAGPWRKFRNVTLPMLSPALLFCLITGFIGSFQVFTQAFVMTNGGPGEATTFYMLHLYNNAFVSLRMGYASAMAWILFALILVLTLVQLRLNKHLYYESEAR
jgi:multiple sugar transport system permease protein